jgi:uncharacterized membrane protein YesL
MGRPAILPPVARPFRAVWLGILDAYNELFPVVGMNLLWLLLNIPLTLVGLAVIQIATSAMSVPEESRQAVGLVFTLLLALLLVIGPNPASAGIHLWANRLVKEERVEFSIFWEGLRQYWRPALALFLISGIGLILLIANALFYLNSDIAALRIFGIIWLYAIVLWMAMQVYPMPLLMEQEDKRLRTVLRNAFFLTMANVVPTLILFVVLGILVAISVAVTLLIALLCAVVVALIAARALQLQLERYRPATPAAD